MQHGPQIKGAYNEKLDTYEYNRSFQFIKPVIESVDIAIANLEVTHAGKPYSGYPQFSAPDEISATLQNTGFDVILTSNNHSCDGGGKGVVRTLDVLDKLGIKHTGTFRNQKERDATYPLIVEEKGIKIAILNYTYGTNGLTVPKPIIVNYIDSAMIKADMKKAREQADYIICTMHWGTEYQRLPNAYQKNWEKYCYELGADMVIGGHPHVIQPVERKIVNGEEKLTAWSLGNFVSNQRDRYTNGGLIVKASIARNENVDGKGNRIELRAASYLLEYVHPKFEGIFKPYYMLPDADYEKIDPNFMNDTEIKAMNLFFEDTRALMDNNAIGVKEEVMDNEKLYSNLFKGYYSVLIDEYDSKEQKTTTTTAQDLTHSYQALNGTKYILSGFSLTEDQAKLNALVLQKLNNVKRYKIVLVNHDGVKIISE